MTLWRFPLVDTGAELVSGKHIEHDPTEVERIWLAFLSSCPIIYCD